MEASGSGRIGTAPGLLPLSLEARPVSGLQPGDQSFRNRYLHFIRAFDIGSRDIGVGGERHRVEQAIAVLVGDPTTDLFEFRAAVERVV